MPSISVPVCRLTSAFEAEVPGSKSLTNRALIAAALCHLPVTLLGALSSEDTEVASKAMLQLGAKIRIHGSTWEVDGSGFQANSAVQNLYLANAGTAVRFMSAVLCAKGVACEVTGSDRMHERPIELMLMGLRELGGNIKSIKNNGCPPLKIETGGLRGGSTALSGQVSSQYFSGLMMAAPLAKNPVEIRVTDEWLSFPYIEMTARMLLDFGIQVRMSTEGYIHIQAPQTYRSPGVYRIEPDATAATYPLALGVLHGVPVKVLGLTLDSLQGDVAFAKVLTQMGCELLCDGGGLQLLRNGPLLGLTQDLNNIPDAAMTVAVLCSVAQGRSQLTGLKNLAFKECDRLTALATELNKLGCRVQAHADGFDIEGVPLETLKGANIETYKDHRMAMCLSLLGTLVPGVVINDPKCVEKTYPCYWDDLNTWIKKGTL
jgi:3-phosphoshikimate 1-carboxyvinyltransferase